LLPPPLDFEPPREPPPLFEPPLFEPLLEPEPDLPLSLSLSGIFLFPL